MRFHVSTLSLSGVLFGPDPGPFWLGLKPLLVEEVLHHLGDTPFTFIFLHAVEDRHVGHPCHVRADFPDHLSSLLVRGHKGAIFYVPTHVHLAVENPRGELFVRALKGV